MKKILLFILFATSLFAQTFRQDQIKNLSDSLNARLRKSANLSDLANTTTARTNLGVYSTAATDLLLGAKIAYTDTTSLIPTKIFLSQNHYTKTATNTLLNAKMAYTDTTLLVPTKNYLSLNYYTNAATDLLLNAKLDTTLATATLRAGWSLAKTRTDLMVADTTNWHTAYTDRLKWDGGAVTNNAQINLGSSYTFKIYGIDRTANPLDGKYLTMFNSSIPGLLTNGYVTINGAIGDPIPTSIAGNTMYMLGIESDVGANPTVVVKTSTGSILKGYDGTNNNVFEVDANGYINSARFKTADNYMYQYSTTRMGFNNGIFSGGDVTIGSASSQREFLVQGGNLVSSKIYANDATVDNKYWSWQAGSAVGDGILRLRAINDALTNGTNAIIFQRTGISKVDVQIPTSLAIGGEAISTHALALAGTSYFNGNATFAGNVIAPTLALGGATIGTNALAVTGTSLFQNIGIDITPTTSISFGGNTDRTVRVERATTAATAGAYLALRGGGAYSTGTDLAGGDLLFYSGISTGSNTSNIRFFTPIAGSSGSTDNTPTEKMRILGSGLVAIGYTSDPTSGNKFAVNGASYFNGNATFAGNVIAPTLALGGASIGTNTLAVTGSIYGSSTLSLGTTNTSQNIVVYGASGAGIRLFRTGYSPRFDIENDGTNLNFVLSDAGAYAWKFKQGSTDLVTISSTGNATFAGNVYLPNGSASAPSIAFTNATQTGFYVAGAGSGATRYSAAGNVAMQVDLNGLTVNGAGWFAFGATDASSAQDLFLRRDAANTLALRNSTSAQTFRIYRTFTSTSDFEALSITGTDIQTIRGSVGNTSQALRFGTANAGIVWQVAGANGQFHPITDNATDFGVSNFRIRTGYFGTSVITPAINNGGADLTINDNIFAYTYYSTKAFGGSALIARSSSNSNRVYANIYNDADGDGQLTLNNLNEATAISLNANGTTFFNGGAIEIRGNYFYLVGDATTDGSWRMSATASGSMKIEKRVSGSWVTASEYTF